MTDTTLKVIDGEAVEKSLAVQDGGAAGLTPYHKEDATQRAALITALGLLATNANASAILAKLSADPATQTTLAAVLAKLSSDPATQTTSAAILAKLTSDPATATNQTGEQTLIGAVTETAPASDTASSGLNGRLQRVAQRLTSLIALFPTAIGQKAKAASLAVTLASDDNLLAKIGEVQASPTANTVLDRLKTVGVAAGAPADVAWTGSGSGSLVAILKALWTKLGSGLGFVASGVSVVSGALVSSARTAAFTPLAGRTFYLELTGAGAATVTPVYLCADTSTYAPNVSAIDGGAPVLVDKVAYDGSVQNGIRIPLQVDQYGVTVKASPGVVTGSVNYAFVQ